MENKKVCPLKFTIATFRDDPLYYQCEEKIVLGGVNGLKAAPWLLFRQN